MAEEQENNLDPSEHPDLFGADHDSAAEEGSSIEHSVQKNRPAKGARVVLPGEVDLANESALYNPTDFLGLSAEVEAPPPEYLEERRAAEEAAMGEPFPPALIHAESVEEESESGSSLLSQVDEPHTDLPVSEADPHETVVHRAVQDWLLTPAEEGPLPNPEDVPDPFASEPSDTEVFAVEQSASEGAERLAGQGSWPEPPVDPETGESSTYNAELEDAFAQIEPQEEEVSSGVRKLLAFAGFALVVTVGMAGAWVWFESGWINPLVSEPTVGPLISGSEGVAPQAPQPGNADPAEAYGPGDLTAGTDTVAETATDAPLGSESVAALDPAEQAQAILDQLERLLAPAQPSNWDPRALTFLHTHPGAPSTMVAVSIQLVAGASEPGVDPIVDSTAVATELPVEVLDDPAAELPVEPVVETPTAPAAVASNTEPTASDPTADADADPVASTETPVETISTPETTVAPGPELVAEPAPAPRGFRSLLPPGSLLDQLQLWQRSSTGDAAPARVNLVPRIGFDLTSTLAAESPFLNSTLGNRGAAEFSRAEAGETVAAQPEMAADTVAQSKPVDGAPAEVAQASNAQEGPKSRLRSAGGFSSNRWLAPEVPLEHLTAKAKIITPNVGRVRVSYKNGEFFEGQLLAIGQNNLWLGSKLGRFTLEGKRVMQVQRLDPRDETAGPDTGKPNLTGLPRVRVTVAGGVFVGHLMSREGSQVTLLTERGDRLTLKSDDVAPVSDRKSSVGIKRRIK